jgi:hypothetical protein
VLGIDIRNVEKSRSTFATFARNSCNILVRHLKHVGHTLATCTTNPIASSASSSSTHGGGARSAARRRELTLTPCSSPGRDPRGPNRGLPRVRAVEVVVAASLFSCPMEELPSAWDAAARRGAPPRQPGQRLRRGGEGSARGGAPCGHLLWRELAAELPAATASRADLTPCGRLLQCGARSGAPYDRRQAHRPEGSREEKENGSMLVCWSRCVKIR